MVTMGTGYYGYWVNVTMVTIGAGYYGYYWYRLLWLQVTMVSMGATQDNMATTLLWLL